MDSKELYELHKGKKAQYHGIIGTVCGYKSDEVEVNQLIIAVDYYDTLDSWRTFDDVDVIESRVNNELGYFYVNDTAVID